MHNLSHIPAESQFEDPIGSFESFEYGQGQEGETRAGDQFFEWDTFSSANGHSETGMAGSLTPSQEMEMATDLLGVTNEAEMDQFLGKLFGQVTKGIGRLLPRGVGKLVSKGLRGIASQALPTLGGAVGNLLLPGIGGAIGSTVAGQAGKMFGLELEGLSAEDQEFETARRIVRLAAETAANATSPQLQAQPPAQAAKQALTAAARIHAPGLLNHAGQVGGPSNGQSGRSGRWIRRGRVIVLYGL